MKNSLRIHKWTHNEFNIFILGVLTHPPSEVREGIKHKVMTTSGRRPPPQCGGQSCV